MALAVQDASSAKLIAKLTSADFPILADEQHQAASAWGVYNLLNDGTATPAVFVIDASGHVIWTYIGKDINDRPSAIEILKQIP